MFNYLFENGILTITREDGYVVAFPYNPETQVNWSSEQEAMDYSNSVPLYFINPVTPNEVLASGIRAERNRLLAESDWTQVADAPVDKAAWATYRQALRDITTQESFPTSVTYPTKP